MEDKLVTLAILTYAKAQILKNVLENEGIETYIHNVNQIQPVVSSGVRLRIKESDLPRALKITESSVWLAEDVVGEKPTPKEDVQNKVLIPVDFSSYSMKACEFGFNFANAFNAEVLLLHVYFTPIYASSLPYGDVFSYQISDDESVKNTLHKVHADLNALSDKIKANIASGKLPSVKFSCVLREGIPEEEILRYTKDQNPRIIVMGTRGKSQKDIDLIGSVTAEILERSKTTVLAIPENTPLNNFSEAKKVAFLTNFDQRDLIAFDSFINTLKSFQITISLIHLSESKDAWNEIKLAGIKEYFRKQYPNIDIHYDVVTNDDFLNSLDNYIKTNYIDVLALTTYKRNIFARMFNPSIARKMIFHSDTPLLVININRSLAKKQ
nr:universal stress protein [uncultured Bacteroides sp.]